MLTRGLTGFLHVRAKEDTRPLEIEPPIDHLRGTNLDAVDDVIAWWVSVLEEQTFIEGPPLSCLDEGWMSFRGWDVYLAVPPGDFGAPLPLRDLYRRSFVEQAPSFHIEEPGAEGMRFVKDQDAFKHPLHELPELQLGVDDVVARPGLFPIEGPYVGVRHEELARVIDLDHLDLQDLRARTRQLMADEVKRAGTSRSALTFAARLEDGVNERLRALLEPPSLQLQLGREEDWIRGSAPRWVAMASGSHVEIELSELSFANARWAAAAIGIEVAAHSEVPAVLLVDEPERGLHRRAERHFAEHLDQFVTGSVALIATSHSPAFLSARGVHPVHVLRDQDRTLLEDPRVVGGHACSFDDAAFLGLDAGEHFQMAHLLVLVEGTMDKEVLMAMFSEELNTHWVRIYRSRDSAMPEPPSRLSGYGD